VDDAFQPVDAVDGHGLKIVALCAQPGQSFVDSFKARQMFGPLTVNVIQTVFKV